MDGTERLRRAAARGDRSAAGRLSISLLERGLLGREHAGTLIRGLPGLGSGVRRGGGWTRSRNRSWARITLPQGEAVIVAAWKGIRVHERGRPRNVYSGHLAVWADPADRLLSVCVRKERARQRTVLEPGWTEGDVAEAIEASCRWAIEVLGVRRRVEALVAMDSADDDLAGLAGPAGSRRRHMVMAAVTLVKLDLGLL